MLLTLFECRNSDVVDKSKIDPPDLGLENIHLVLYFTYVCEAMSVSLEIYVNNNYSYVYKLG